jgi:hypothetical protein
LQDAHTYTTTIKSLKNRRSMFIFLLFFQGTESKKLVAAGMATATAAL